MVLTFLAIFIIMVIAGIIVYQANDNSEVGPILVVIGAIGGVISFIATLCLVGSCINLKTVDLKIEMYTAENKAIEQQIDVAVQKYMSYEKEVMNEASPESSITLVAAFPELASDELVQKQIDVYLCNNKKIKELKENKINGAAKQWWLYFGGNLNEQLPYSLSPPETTISTE